MIKNSTSLRQLERFSPDVAGQDVVAVLPGLSLYIERWLQSLIVNLLGLLESEVRLEIIFDNKLFSGLTDIQ